MRADRCKEWLGVTQLRCFSTIATNWSHHLTSGVRHLLLTLAYQLRPRFGMSA